MEIIDNKEDIKEHMKNKENMNEQKGWKWAANRTSVSNAPQNRLKKWDSVKMTLKLFIGYKQF